MTNATLKLSSLIEMLSDEDMFLCENNLQARTMSEGFVQEATKLKALVERLERDLLVEQRRYTELMEHKNEIAKEVQCARMAFEIMKGESQALNVADISKKQYTIESKNLTGESNGVS